MLLYAARQSANYKEYFASLIPHIKVENFTYSINPINDFKVMQEDYTDKENLSSFF